MKWILLFLVATIAFIKLLPDEVRLNAAVDDQRQPALELIRSEAAPRQLQRSAQSPAKPKHSFRCDGRKYCSQMTSCAEATYFLQNCPGVKMDGNHDGVPCEMQWCN